MEISSCFFRAAGVGQPATAGRRVRGRAGRRAFTLVELLVAMTVLLVIILLMVGLTNQTNRIWRSSRARITAFQAGRNAFERITANLSQATLNTYLDYYNKNGKSRSDWLRQGQSASLFVPYDYDRAADLQFVCGQSTLGGTPLIPPASSTTVRPTHAVFFQCPLGHVDNPNETTGTGGTAAPTNFKALTNVLNAVGYYVEFSNENDPKYGKVPAFLNAQPASWRYRLMELNQPSQNLLIYSPNTAGGNPNYPFANPGSWFSLAVDPAATGTAAPVFVVADNIVALVVRPKLANPTATGTLPQEIAPFYSYDTKQYLNGSSDQYTKMAKNQLPPLVQVTLVAIDADSATRLANRYNVNPPPLVDASLFTDVTKYDTDIATLQASLQKNQLNYRIFVTDVSVPGAKWSQTTN